MDEFKELYENLSPNKLSIENVTQLGTKVELLEQEIKQLETALNKSELDKRNLNISYEREKKHLLKNHESVLANISALFKTARKEIERKNDTIKELRQQLDDFIFRRNQRRAPSQNEVVRSKDEHEPRICRKSKERQRYSPYKHRKEDHDRSRYKDRQQERDFNDEEYLKSRTKRSPYRDHHEFGNSHRPTDFGLEDVRANRKTKEDCRGDYSDRAASDDRQREVESSAKKSVDDRRRQDPAFEKLSNERRKQSPSYFNLSHRNSTENRRRADLAPLESNVRTSTENRVKEDEALRKSTEDRRKVSPANLEPSGRNCYENRRRAELASFESNVRTSTENRIKENVALRKSAEDQRKVSPANHKLCGREDRQRADLAPLESNTRKSMASRMKESVALRKSAEDRRNVSLASHEVSGREDRRRTDIAPLESNARTSMENRMEENVSVEDQKRASPVNFRDDLAHTNSGDHLANSRRSYEGRQRNHLADSESSARKLMGDWEKEELDHQKSVRDRRRENLATLELADRKSISNQGKEDLVNQRLIENQRPGSTANLEFAGQKSTENRRRENGVIQPEHSRKKLIEERRKDNPAHVEVVAKQLLGDQTDPVHPRLATKKLINDRKRDFAGATLGGQKSIVNQKRENLSSTKRIDKKPNNNRRIEDTVNSSQKVIENQVSSGSHVESDYPADGQIKAVDILAQYGVYATPYKLQNGDECNFGGFKLVSPIADTPNHLKELFTNSKVKVSPIPMLNERRVLDGFDSPAKKPVTPAKAAVEDPAANKNSSEEPSKKRLTDDSIASPSPSKLLLLNTVTTSPFKNCCIVKVKAEVVNKSPVETAAKEPVTVSGTDTTNAEHGVFTRKRRAPVIRHIKKAESQK